MTDQDITARRGEAPADHTALDHLCSWLRARRGDLLRDPADPRRDELWRNLGLDDATLTAFAAAPRTVVTLPHASPNVFFPRAYNAWYARHLQRRDPALFHWRIVLTHTNFSDLNWRPYAWWYLDPAGDLARLTLFTRNKKRKHVVVASQPPPTGPAPAMRDAERRAFEAACGAANMAYADMQVTACLEREAGLAAPHRTVFMPLDLLIRFCREEKETLGGPAAAAWIDALFARAAPRAIAPSGELEDATADTAFVLDNNANLALLALFAHCSVAGGGVMGGYWDQVGAVVRAANAATGLDLRGPGLLRRPEVNAGAARIAPSERLAESLRAAGLRYSQGMAVSEHGFFARDLDPFA